MKFDIFKAVSVISATFSEQHWRWLRMLWRTCCLCLP